MVWRILGKLLFKALASLVLVLGVLSYGHYLRGGDPGFLWKISPAPALSELWVS